MPRSLFPERVRTELRACPYRFAYRDIEKTYPYWMRQFVIFGDKWHPFELGGPDIGRFLNYPHYEVINNFVK